MEENLQKIKSNIINYLSKGNQDEKFLIKGKKSYSRKDLITELTNNTDFGIEIISDMIILTIDLVSRKKLKY